MLQDVSTRPIWAREVTYTDDVTLWGLDCKSTAYAYQREYRFGFGTCSVSETEPHVFDHPDGFGRLIYKNADFVMRCNEDGSVLLDLMAI